MLRGNLFDSRDHEDQRDLATNSASAICRTRTIPTRSKGRPSCSTGPRTITPASTIRRSAIDEHSILFMRGAGPIGYPGAAEVVNMRPPAYLIERGHHSAALHRRRPAVRHVGQPSILNASPEAAAGGGLALLQTGDRVRIDLEHGRADVLIDRSRVGSDAARSSRPPAAIAIRPRKRRGRKSSARSSASSATGAILEGGEVTSASPRRAACRATTTDRHAGGRGDMRYHRLAGLACATWSQWLRRLLRTWSVPPRQLPSGVELRTAGRSAHRRTVERQCSSTSASVPPATREITIRP